MKEVKLVKLVPIQLSIKNQLNKNCQTLSALRITFVFTTISQKMVDEVLHSRYMGCWKSFGLLDKSQNRMLISIQC